MLAADWTQDEAYADLHLFDGSALAWEFLRRNSSYQQAYAAAADCARFGLVFPLDPRLPASRSDPIWRWEFAPAYAVMLAPAPASSATRRRLAHSAAFSRRAESGLYVRFCNGLQAHIPPAVCPDEPLAAVLPLDRELLLRFSAARLLHAGLLGRWRRAACLSPARRRRLARTLRAIDGREQGASYREIAALVMGERTAGSLAWRTSSARASVIRLCAAGRELVRGGYSTLLGRTVATKG